MKSSAVSNDGTKNEFFAIHYNFRYGGRASTEVAVWRVTETNMYDAIPKNMTRCGISMNLSIDWSEIMSREKRQCHD